MNLQSIPEIPKSVSKWKPHSAYKESGNKWLKEIPSNWRVLPLRRLVDRERPITYGIVQCGPDVSPNGIPYIRPVDMRDEAGVDISVLQHTTSEIAQPYARSTIREADLVVSIGPSFGKLMTVPSELTGANLTQGTARVAPGSIRGRYLFWYLRSGLASAFWEAGCNGATFHALTLWTLGQTPVAVPLSDEQNAIIEFLDRETAKIDALVAKKEQLIELLQEKRAALITRAVTKGLDLNVPMKNSGVEWLDKIPAHWQVKRLKMVCSRVIVGIAEAATHAYADEGIPIVRSTDVRPNRIDTQNLLRIDSHFAGRLRSKALRARDIVTVRTGNAGISAVVPPDLDGSQCFTLVVSSPSPGENSDFLCYFLNSHVAQLQFTVEGMGTAQINISVPIVANVVVCVPDGREQKQIAEFLHEKTAEIDALVARVREGIEKLKEYRTALISAAVTGKIDVRDQMSL